MPAVVESLNKKIDQLIESDRKKTKQIENMKKYVSKKVKGIKKILKRANIEIHFDNTKNTSNPNQRVTRSRAAKQKVNYAECDSESSIDFDEISEVSLASDDSEESEIPEALHTTTATRLIYNEKKRKRAVQADDVRP